MPFKFGTKSKKHMEGVHPDIVKLAEETIKMSPIDMTVLATGGLRTASMQMALYKKGASKLDGRRVKSKHQKQPSGFGEALDLVPWVVGSPRWEWPLIYPIAACMAINSKRFGIDIRWGGVWDRKLHEYIGTANSIEAIAQKMKAEVRAYTIRHAGPDFIDGPHFEMRR